MSSLTPSGFSRDIAENAFKAIEEVAGALGFNAAMTCATEFINPLSLMTAFAFDEVVVKNISSQNEVVKRMAEAVHHLLISRFESASLTPSGFRRDIAENAFKAIEEVAGALGFNAAMTCATEFINPLSLMTAFALDEIVVKNISSQNEVVKRMAEAVHFLLISRFESAFYHDVKDQIDAGAFAEAFARIAGTDSSHKTLAWYELGRALVHKKMFGMAQRCLENMDESRIEAHCLRCLWEHANAFIEDRIDYLWVRTQFEAMINCYTDRDFSKFCNGAPTDKLELATPIFNRVLDSCSIEEIRLICERAKQPDGFFRPQNLVGGFILTVFRQKFNDL